MSRSGIKRSVREKIYARDGHQCLWCGHTGKYPDGTEDRSNPLTIDHIVPVSEGGTNRQSNLQTLCRNCNLARNRDYQRRADAQTRKGRGERVWRPGFLPQMSLSCACCDRVVLIAENALIEHVPMVLCQDCGDHTDVYKSEVCPYRGQTYGYDR